MPYSIEITPAALEALESIANRRTRGAIARRVDALAEEPEKQGKRLRAPLAGFLSVRAAGQRYRVVYTIDQAPGRVLVYMIGIRKEGSRNDVYALAERLVRRGLM
jgi:mRNA interferase RelE/StbE